MNIISIILKEIKQSFRDKSSLCLMILFPIVLITILGFALDSWFGNNSDQNLSFSALYCIQDNSQFGQNFEKGIIKNDNGSIKMKYIKTNDVNAGKKLVSENKYDGLIVIKGNKMQFFENKVYSTKSSLIEQILNVYVQRYNTVLQIAKVNPYALNKITWNDKLNFVKDVSIQKKKSPRAIDYYAITMLTLIIMYASKTSMYGIINDRKRKTQSRILCAPVNKYEFLTGKILGNVIVSVLQTVIVILFSKYVLKTYWGSNEAAVFLIILSVIIFSISLGAGLSFVIQDTNVAEIVLSLLIPVIVFLGGGYVPLSLFGGKLINFIAKLSPLDWSNNAILNIIYANDYSMMWYAVLINIAISIVFILLSAFIFKKEEA